MDWLQALDPKLTLANVHVDILGDWYRDPWSWAELSWLVEKSPERLAARLNESGFRRVLLIDVPKENFVIRPATLLDPLDRLMYQALVDRVSRSIVGNLRGWVYGWRLTRGEAAAGRYARNSAEWAFYRSRLQFLATQMPHGLTTDIVSFFATVSIDRLIDDLRSKAGNNEVVARLGDFLGALQSVPTRKGLPQRCWASSVLAHFYIHPIDDLLDAAAPTIRLLQSSRPAVTRWMDDIWMFANKPMDLRLLQLQLQDLLRQRGLTMNAAKTNVYEGEELQQQAKELEHSAIDQALASPMDDQPLRELVDKLLKQGASASRTSIRFATTRIRDHEVFDLVPSFVPRVFEMPHAADHLARLFRDSEAWRDLINWYLTASEEFGSSLTWSIYHLGTMFPSDELPSKELSRNWAESLSSGRTPLLMVPLVAQRLAVWDPDSGRAAFRAAAGQIAYQHPFAMRAIAFAGVTAGMSPSDIKPMLAQFGENEVTLRYLESRNMKAPKTADDFAGP